MLVRGLVREFGRVEITVVGAAAEVPGADLPDEVAARTQVVLRQAALTGVVGEAAGRGAPVEREDRVGRQRPETHRRHVQQRHVVRAGAVGAADAYPWRGLRHLAGCHGGDEELVAGQVHVPFGAERLLRVGALRALVDDAAHVPVEGPPVVVPLDEVLLEFGAYPLQQKAGVPQDGIVP